MKLAEAWSSDYFDEAFPSHGELLSAMQHVGAVFNRWESDTSLGVDWLLAAISEESRLSAEEWYEFVQVILDEGDGEDGVGDPADPVIDWSLEYVLLGPECPTANVLGHIFTLDDLEEVLTGEMVSTTVARQAISLLLGNDSEDWKVGVEKLNRVVNPSAAFPWTAAPLAKRPMWATFSETSDYPLDGLPAESIASALGIAEGVGRSGLYLMKYKLSKGVVGRHPRFVDALVSLGWSAKFVPPGEADVHGWTCPDQSQHDLRRPLVVHNVISASHLVGGFELLDVGLERFLLNE